MRGKSILAFEMLLPNTFNYLARMKAFIIIFLSALLLLISCKKQEKELSVVSDDVINYFHRFDTGSYWVFKTTFASGRETIDTLFAVNQCEIVRPNCSGSGDDACLQYLEILTMTFETRRNSNLSFGAVFWSASNNVTEFYRDKDRLKIQVSNNLLTFPEAKDTLQAYYTTFPYNGKNYHNTLFLIKNYVSNKPTRYAYFAKDEGFFLLKTDSSVSEVIDKKLIYRTRFCRDNFKK